MWGVERRTLEFCSPVTVLCVGRDIFLLGSRWTGVLGSMANLSEEGDEVVSQSGSEEDAVEDAGIFDGEGALHPDHPLLRRAQEALKAQLVKAKAELEEVVREKSKALKVRAGA